MKEKFTRKEVEELLRTVYMSEFAYGIQQYAEDNNFVKTQAIDMAVQETMSVSGYEK